MYLERKTAYIPGRPKNRKKNLPPFFDVTFLLCKRSVVVIIFLLNYQPDQSLGNKGVSDLKTHLDYSYHYARSFENLKFCLP